MIIQERTPILGFVGPHDIGKYLLLVLPIPKDPTSFCLVAPRFKK